MHYIVIEGADGAGKSTLVASLRQHYGDRAQTYHQGPFTGNVVDQTLRVLYHANTHARGATDDVSIFDRLHIGERVYGPLFRGVDLCGSTGVRMIERYMLSRARCTVILCDPGWKVVRGNWSASIDAEMVKEERVMGEIHSAYTSIRDMTHLPVVTYDYTSDNVTDLIEAVESQATSPMVAPSRIGAKPLFGCAPLRDSVLLAFSGAVGLAVSDVHQGAPFVGPTPWHHGLNAAFGHIDERRLSWLAGAPTRVSVATFKEPKGVIALDDHAAEQLLRMGIEAYRADAKDWVNMVPVLLRLLGKV